jgi:CDP-glucose 4,6-dehydratase
MNQVFKNKKIFLTGHTGFKGAWLLQVLAHLGADVKGYSLAPDNDSLYQQVKGDQFCYSSVIADVRDEHTLQGEMIRFQPDYVFHLAAQSLVRYSYEFPALTFDVNVMGTVNVLNALRSLEKPCVGVMITTDKVYENNEEGIPFKEDDKLGGYDPYSASKAAAEIAITSYRNSYFNPQHFSRHQKSIASVRAGNVIGGGDFSANRIIPDIVRSIQEEKPVSLRHPMAVRPWQHVLEPLHAYISLALLMEKEPVKYATSFNVGPDIEDILDVETVVKYFIQYYGQGSYTINKDTSSVHEAHHLMLNNEKIKKLAGWHPKYDAKNAIKLTADWYADQQHDAVAKCLQQIQHYGFHF